MMVMMMVARAVNFFFKVLIIKLFTEKACQIA